MLFPLRVIVSRNSNFSLFALCSAWVFIDALAHVIASWKCNSPHLMGVAFHRQPYAEKVEVSHGEMRTYSFISKRFGLVCVIPHVWGVLIAPTCGGTHIHYFFLIYNTVFLTLYLPCGKNHYFCFFDLSLYPVDFSATTAKEWVFINAVSDCLQTYTKILSQSGDSHRPICCTDIIGRFKTAFSLHQLLLFWLSGIHGPLVRR